MLQAWQMISSICDWICEKGSCTVQLDYNFKKLACAITHALHEQQRYRGVFASAREIDDVSTARRVLKNSSRV